MRVLAWCVVELHTRVLMLELFIICKIIILVVPVLVEETSPEVSKGDKDVDTPSRKSTPKKQDDDDEDDDEEDEDEDEEEARSETVRILITT